MQRFLILNGDKTTANGPAVYRALSTLDEQRKAIVPQTYGRGFIPQTSAQMGNPLPSRRRLDVDILNMKNMTFESRDPAYTPEFPLQACDNQR
jgi:hypothetical protein